MSNPAYRYGSNLLWFLDNLAEADLEGVDGEMEVYGENEQGQEGSCDINLNELGESAAARIRQLEETIKKLQGVG